MTVEASPAEVSEALPPPPVPGWRWPMWYAIGRVTGGLIPVLASPVGDFALAFRAPLRVWIVSLPAGAAAFVLGWAILATDGRNTSFADYGYKLYLLAATVAALVVMVLCAFGLFLGAEISRKIRTR